MVQLALLRDLRPIHYLGLADTLAPFRRSFLLPTRQNPYGHLQRQLPVRARARHRGGKTCPQHPGSPAAGLLLARC